MVAIIACARAPGLSKRESEPSAEPKVVVAPKPSHDSAHEKVEGQPTAPRVGGTSDAPVETAPANVPEFRPAFPGQTRAPAIHTQTNIVVTELAKELDLPWAIAFVPDGHMFLTEKHTGKLYYFGPAGLRSQPTNYVPAVDGRGQGGLLDVAIDPKYEQNQLIYLSYYEPREGGNGLAVLRARFENGAPPRLEQSKVIFRMQPTLASDKHAGGRLVFANDGTLFITLGERSVKEGRVQARDPGSHFGKIVRIFPDGSVPKDNPFVGKPGARPEIWSLGHRNVLGADLDAQGRLWIAEMGPRGGDELNLVLRGKDYGWPTIGYGEEYSGKAIHQRTQAPGLEQPVYYWDPVISPAALEIYSGDLFPEWKGNFLIAGLSGQALVRLAVEGDRVVGEERLLTDRSERFRDVVQGPDGAVYLLTDEGKLLKLTPRGPDQVAEPAAQKGPPSE
jgi:glucose/arabinose dehydrogenase